MAKISVYDKFMIDKFMIENYKKRENMEIKEIFT